LDSIKKILIVEDEPLIADDLAFIIGDFGYAITDKVLSVAEAIASIEKNTPDIVMLDIALKGDDDGVDLAKIINDRFQIPFLFLTSNADQLTINRVKKTNPAGFILKPFREKELKTQLAIALYKTDRVQTIKTPTTNVFIRVGSDMISLEKEAILFAKADDNYTFIYTESKEYCVSINLKKFIQKLDSEQFFRVHRSYLVNLKKINKISEGYVFVQNQKIPVGRAFSSALKKRIQII